MVTKILKQSFVYYFKMNAIFLRFMTRSISGYVFFIFLIHYLVFGYIFSNFGFVYACCLLLVFYIVSTAIFFYILVKFKPTRQFLENCVGKNYLIDLCGVHMMSAVVVRAAGTLALGITGTEVLTYGSRHYAQQERMEWVVGNYERSLGEDRSIWGADAIKQCHEETLAIINEPIRGGVVTDVIHRMFDVEEKIEIEKTKRETCKVIGEVSVEGIKKFPSWWG